MYGLHMCVYIYKYGQIIKECNINNEKLKRNVTIKNHVFNNKTKRLTSSSLSKNILTVQ